MAGIDLNSILTLSLIAAALRMATPIIFATMGGIFSSHAGIFNVGLEGLMLIGTFFAVVGSVQTGSAYGGMLYAVVACLIASLVFAFLHLELKQRCYCGSGFEYRGDWHDELPPHRFIGRLWRL